MTPEQSVGIELRVRQFFPTVPALLHDSYVAAEAQEVVEKTQQIFATHRRSSFFAADTR
jgi:hypothetical protein